MAPRSMDRGPNTLGPGPPTKSVSHLVCLARIFITSYALHSRVRSPCRVFPFASSSVLVDLYHYYLLSRAHRRLRSYLAEAVRLLTLPDFAWISITTVSVLPGPRYRTRCPSERPALTQLPNLDHTSGFALRLSLTRYHEHHQAETSTVTLQH